VNSIGGAHDPPRNRAAEDDSNDYQRSDQPVSDPARCFSRKRGWELEYSVPCVELRPTRTDIHFDFSALSEPSSLSAVPYLSRIHIDLSQQYRWPTWSVATPRGGAFMPLENHDLRARVALSGLTPSVALITHTPVHARRNCSQGYRRSQKDHVIERETVIRGALRQH